MRGISHQTEHKITLYNYESGLGHVALKDITTRIKKWYECDEALVLEWRKQGTDVK